MDHNGTISTSEFVNALEQLNVGADRKISNEIKDMVDLNNDGKVDYFEFVKTLEHTGAEGLAQKRREPSGAEKVASSPKRGGAGNSKPPSSRGGTAAAAARSGTPLPVDGAQNLQQKVGGEEGGGGKVWGEKKADHKEAGSRKASRAGSKAGSRAGSRAASRAGSGVLLDTRGLMDLQIRQEEEKREVMSVAALRTPRID